MTITFYNENCITGCQQHIKDNSIDLIITDPPYGINATKIERQYNRTKKNIVQGYIEIPKEEYQQFTHDWITQAERILRPGGSIYIISGYTNLHHILNELHQTNLKEVNHIIWKYNFGVYTQNKYVSSHYHILYWQKPGGTPTFNLESRHKLTEKDSNNRSVNYQDREDVWIINREYKHNQRKTINSLPIELLTKIIQYSSNSNDTICDLFAGSGSTLYTSYNLNRKSIGFEQSPEVYTFAKANIEKNKS